MLNQFDTRTLLRAIVIAKKNLKCLFIFVTLYQNQFREPEENNLLINVSKQTQIYC